MAAVLAGCAGDAQPAPDPADPCAGTSASVPATPACAAAPPAVDLVGCTADYAFLAAPAADVAALLPPGYAPAHTPLSTVVLAVRSCEAAVVSATQRTQAFLDLVVTVAVAPPPEAADAAADDAFVLDWLVSDAGVADALAGAGLPARAATASASPDPTGVRHSFQAAGSTYDLVFSYVALGEPSGFTQATRLHLGPMRWADSATSQEEPLTLGAATVRATGTLGPLADPAHAADHGHATSLSQHLQTLT